MSELARDKGRDQAADDLRSIRAEGLWCPTVSMVVVNPDDDFLFVRSIKAREAGSAAKFKPIQGGIEEGESVRAAGCRELWEEADIHERSIARCQYLESRTRIQGGRYAPGYKGKEFLPCLARLNETPTITFSPEEIFEGAWWPKDRVVSTLHDSKDRTFNQTTRIILGLALDALHR